MSTHEIVLIHVPHRAEHALKVQEVLTKHGQSIKTRLGLHDAEHGSGVIIMEMMGAPANYGNIEAELKAAGAEMQRVTFHH